MHHDWWRKQAANGGVAPTQGCGIHRNAIEPGRNRGPPGLVAIDHLGSRGGSCLGVGGGIFGRQASRGSCVIGGARGYAIDANLARPGHQAIAQVLQCGVELLPALRHAQIIRAWSGTEGYLPDREPVIWPSSATPGWSTGLVLRGLVSRSGRPWARCLRKWYGTAPARRRSRHFRSPASRMQRICGQKVGLQDLQLQRILKPAIDQQLGYRGGVGQGHHDRN